MIQVKENGDAYLDFGSGHTKEEFLELRENLITLVWQITGMNDFGQCYALEDLVKLIHFMGENIE